MSKKRKEYSRVIITDDTGKPMAWSGDQLCYCTDEFWQDPHFPVRTYAPTTAKKHIQNSTKFRRDGNFPLTRYKTMPFFK